MATARGHQGGVKDTSMIVGLLGALSSRAAWFRAFHAVKVTSVMPFVFRAIRMYDHPPKKHLVQGCV